MLSIEWHKLNGINARYLTAVSTCKQSIIYARIRYMVTMSWALSYPSSGYLCSEQCAIHVFKIFVDH